MGLRIRANGEGAVGRLVFGASGFANCWNVPPRFPRCRLALLNGSVPKWPT